jgi:DNA-binding GntR family transcriptional regulator
MLCRGLFLLRCIRSLDAERTRAGDLNLQPHTPSIHQHLALLAALGCGTVVWPPGVWSGHSDRCC